MISSAVLLSGGLDSAVLLADEAAHGEVQPIYVSVGLAWENAERQMVDALLAAPPLAGRAAPLASLSVDMRDVYAATHWAMEGRPPSYHTPDEDVYLPGRNIVLLSKAGVFCAAAHIGRVVIGTLEHNPFPDATPEFRSILARALSLGLAHDLRIDAPYAGTSKAEVVRRGVALGVPFDLTLSCMAPQRSGQWSVSSGQASGSNSQHSGHRPPDTGPQPADTDRSRRSGQWSVASGQASGSNSQHSGHRPPDTGPQPADTDRSRRSGQWSVASGQASGSNSQHSGQLPLATGHWPLDTGDRPLATHHYIHCGKCSKCRERHDAFVEAGIADPTEYADTANLA